MWTENEIDLITRTGEVRVSSRRPDGTFTRGITIWAVAVDGEIYVRSTDGPDKPWFRAALARGSGRLVVGETTFDVTYSDGSVRDRRPLDAEYRRKYRRSPSYNINRAANSTATLHVSSCENATPSGGVKHR